MKLTKKITLSLLLIFGLTLSSSALTINTFSLNKISADADMMQKDKGSSQGGNRNGGGGGGGNSGGSRNIERPSPPPRNDSPRSRDGEKQPLVIKRAEKGKDRKGDSE
jgi:hypothetical protein